PASRPHQHPGDQPPPVDAGRRLPGNRCRSGELIMRPYLAIIKDSFREALSSRILYIMLGLITVLLLLVAPLTYRQELTIGLHDDDADWPELIDQLKLAEKETKASPTRRIWTQLTPDQQKKVSE